MTQDLDRAYHGRCNICEAYGPLTDDHVPPKGCGRFGSVQAMPLSQLHKQPTERQWQIHQGGPHFKTLCKACNSWLGSKYDHLLADFVQQIRKRTVGNGALVLPGTMLINVQPHRLAKALAGHFLAIMPNDPPPAEGTQLLRQFVRDEKALLPRDWGLYAWPYYRSMLMVLHGIVILNSFSGQQICGSVLKFKPVAFMLTQGETSMAPPGAQDLLASRPSTADGWNQIDFDIRDRVHPAFPEHPEPNAVVVYADPLTVVAEQYSSRRSRRR